jgi:branched-chain amino acid transport system permease protein
MDLNIIATAFVVVVVGGMGSITGAFLASIIIGELNALAVLVVPELAIVSVFAVMAVVLILRPHGLLGRPESLAQSRNQASSAAPALYPPRALVAAALAASLALPWFIGDYGLIIAIEVVIMAVFAYSLFAIMGPGGMVSFGHAAYFGAGAYGAALLVQHAGAGMAAALVAAPLAAGAVALLFGWFCVRLSGVYLAMLTLAFAQLLWAVLQQWTAVTGGDDGILGLWPAAWVQSRIAYYYLVLGLGLLGVGALWFGLSTPFGWALRAARDNPVRALASGIPVRRVQWLAFTMAGSLAGLAGALYAFSKGSVFPDEAGIIRSVDALLMVLLGGLESLLGPLLGATALTGLQESFSRLPIWRLLLGLAIIVICVVLPGGLTGLNRLWRPRRS